MVRRGGRTANRRWGHRQRRKWGWNGRGGMEMQRERREGVDEPKVRATTVTRRGMSTRERRSGRPTTTPVSGRFDPRVAERLRQRVACNPGVLPYEVRLSPVHRRDPQGPTRTAVACMFTTLYCTWFATSTSVKVCKALSEYSVFLVMNGAAARVNTHHLVGRITGHSGPQIHSDPSSLSPNKNQGLLFFFENFMDRSHSD